jgi:hypothetical protein
MFVLVDNQFVVHGGQTLVNGSVSIAVPGLSRGTHRLEVQYLGDSNYQRFDTFSGQGPTINIADPTTTTLSLSPGPSLMPGSPLTISGMVTGTDLPVVSSGSVQITVDGTPLGAPIPVTSTGAFSLTSSIARAGPHTILASYLGNSSWAPSSAGSPNNFQVTPFSLQVTVSSSPNPSTYGQSLVLTAIVSVTAGSPLPIGRLQLFDGSTPLGGVLGITSTAANSVGYRLTVPSGSLPPLTRSTQSFARRIKPAREARMHNHRCEQSVSQS